MAYVGSWVPHPPLERILTTFECSPKQWREFDCTTTQTLTQSMNIEARQPPSELWLTILNFDTSISKVRTTRDSDDLLSSWMPIYVQYHLTTFGVGKETTNIVYNICSRRPDNCRPIRHTCFLPTIRPDNSMSNRVQPTFTRALGRMAVSRVPCPRARVCAHACLWACEGDRAPKQACGTAERNSATNPRCSVARLLCSRGKPCGCHRSASSSPTQQPPALHLHIFWMLPHDTLHQIKAFHCLGTRGHRCLTSSDCHKSIGQRPMATAT